MIFAEKRQLRIPGPTPIPPQILRAGAQPMMGHRSGDFVELCKRVAAKVKTVFQTENDVFILTSSGTGALEAAVANTVSPGDQVLVLVSGVFGERFVKIANAYGAQVETIRCQFGHAIDPQTVTDALVKKPEIKVVFATHCETSTGVVNDLEKIAEAVHSSPGDPLLVVDTVSSMGGIEFKTDKWGIDLVVSGSQKAFMLPPGLAFIGVSDRSWDIIEANQSPRFYFDLRAYRKSLPKGQTPFTPAVSLFYQLEEALAMMEAEGFANIYQRHLLMRDMVRAAVRALGLPLFVAEDNNASATVTSILGPQGLDVEALRKLLNQKYKLVLAGGQADLKGKIFRIGHMGFAEPTDMLAVLATLELGLVELGWKLEGGAAVRAAEEVLVRG